MINESEDDYIEKEFPAVADIGRPDIYSDSTRSMWKAIHGLIKNGKIEMLVNPMFYFIDEIIKADKNYMGGGTQYCFWFRTEEDKHTFMSQMRNL